MIYQANLKLVELFKRSQNYEKEQTVPVNNAFVVKNHQQPYKGMSQCMWEASMKINSLTWTVKVCKTQLYLKTNFKRIWTNLK